MDEAKTLLEAQISALTTERDEAKIELADVHAQAKATLKAKTELELVLEALKSRLLAPRTYTVNRYTVLILDSPRHVSVTRDTRKCQGSAG
jgi:hypothetical protein